MSEIMAAMNDRFAWQEGSIEREGTRLAYIDSGSGERCVVLVHGVNQNRRTWELLLPWLDDGYRYLALDQRGHGKSDRPGVTYTPGDLVADLQAIVTELGLRRYAIAGHSLGGWVGMQQAAAQPEQVAGLVIGDMTAAPRLESTSQSREAMRAALQPGAGDASWADADEAFAYLKATSTIEGEQQVRARMRQQLRRRADGRLERDRSATVAKAILEDVWQTDLWPLLPRIKCPVAVVHAQHSDILNAETARRMAETIPNAELVEVADSYHNLQLFRPREFASAINALLARASF